VEKLAAAFNIFFCVPVCHFKFSVLPEAAVVNPLNAELNTIRHLLALPGAHHFVDVSRIRVN
jgi:hypothetical protein